MANKDLSTEQRTALRAELKATQKLFKEAKIKMNAASTAAEKKTAAKALQDLANDCAGLKARLAG